MFIDFGLSTVSIHFSLNPTDLYFQSDLAVSCNFLKMDLPFLSSEQSKSLDYIFNPKPSALINYWKCPVIAITGVILK